MPAEAPAEVVEAAAKPGNTLGKFVLVRKVGQGTFGAVYLAWQTDLARYVALAPGASDRGSGDRGLAVRRGR